MEFRNYDPAIARFNGIDPVTHFSQGTSVAFDNNPIYWADPSGADSEYYQEPDKPGTYDGETYTDEDGTFIWDGENWHSDMGGGLILEEIIIGGSGTSASDDVTGDDAMYDENGISLTYESISSDSDLNKVLFSNAAAYTPQAYQWLSRNATIQRKVLIEDFGQVVVRNKFFARGLANLSNYSRGFGPITDAAFTSYDTYQVINGKMSASKYIYNIVGLGSSFYAAATVSNPAGAFVGTLFGLGSLLYDSAFDIKEHIINNAPSINFNSGFWGH